MEPPLPKDKTEEDKKLKVKKAKKVEIATPEAKPLKEPEKKIDITITEEKHPKEPEKKVKVKEVVVTLSITTSNQDSSEDTIRTVVKEIKKIANVDITRVEIYDDTFNWYLDITDKVSEK